MKWKSLRTHELTWVALALALIALLIFAFPREKTFVVRVGKKPITVEIADDVQKRTKGLSGRASMPIDHGMLFTYDRTGIYSFWMKGMLFPIDIVWIKDGIVVETITLQPPTSTDGFIPRHMPEHEANRVLELNAGQAEKTGFIPGAWVYLPE